MVAVLNPPAQLAEQRVLLRADWELYQRLLAKNEDCSNPRFAYNDGWLEIMTLSERHEEPNRTLALLVEVLAEEFGYNLRRLGSTTFTRADLLKGVEPDSCFYLQNLAAVRGKAKIDLARDPPPDLVIEVDITHPSLDKLPIFAGLGVPEIWLCDGRRVKFLRLTGENYRETTHSLALSLLTDDIATRFLRANEELESLAWLRQVRAWAREA
jgi:Uma2 family endonuclease